MTACGPLFFAPVDADFSNVVLLCHFDGTAGGITTIDSSLSNHAMTMSGATLESAQTKFGATSVYTGVAAASGVSSVDSADWYFGSGKFTLEAWCYFSLHSATTEEDILSQWGGASNLGWAFGMDTTGRLAFYYSTTGTNVLSVGAAYSPPLSQWIHMAVDRDTSNVLRVYANGVVVASATVSATFFDSSQSLRIGNNNANFVRFPGYIDEVRITKGVARYAGPFTPPTAAFPNA